MLIFLGGLLIMSMSPKKMWMAASFIRVQLLEGPKPWQQIVDAGAEFGHTEGTLRRARREVAECWRIDRGNEHYFEWALKDEED